MVNIGIVGIGFMGMTHYKAMAQVQGGQVAAIVSRDPKKRAGDWNDIQGNFGDSGGVQDLSGIRCYETLDELLADGEIDLVDICLPTNMHVETSIRVYLRASTCYWKSPLHWPWTTPIGLWRWPRNTSGSLWLPMCCGISRNFG